MKTLMNKIPRIALMLFLFLATGINAFAADGDTLTSADYHFAAPKHLDPLYNGPLRFVVMGVLAAIILYMAYRYFIDNRTHTGHEPHHQ